MKDHAGRELTHWGGEAPGKEAVDPIEWSAARKPDESKAVIGVDEVAAVRRGLERLQMRLDKDPGGELAEIRGEVRGIRAALNLFRAAVEERWAKEDAEKEESDDYDQEQRDANED